jgi:hypothetical protein
MCCMRYRVQRAMCVGLCGDRDEDILQLHIVALFIIFDHDLGLIFRV